MPNAFNFSASPFHCLDPQEQELVRRSVDIAYFRQATVILEVGAVPTHLFVIIKGYVTQTEGNEVVATYGPDDTFDGRGLVAGRVSSRFVAAEEVLAYELAHEAVNALIASNTTFGALLFSDIGQKLNTLAHRPDQHELQSLTLSRVDAAYLRPAHKVDAQTDIISVVRLFQAHRTTSVLVTGLPEGLGVFSNSTLQCAVLDGRPLDQIPVGDFATRPVVTVRPSDQLGDAMALLLRCRVHRLVVTEGDEVLGILDALDLFSFLANQSHLITVKIEHAQDLATLSQAAGQITQLIRLLHRGGTRIGLMMTLVQQLNTRLFEQAWQMVAPPDLVAHSCLFVMGSEGRGEQLLKTDQDNGLILQDGYTPPPDLDAICQRFSAALADFGYPECPGHIMVSNPAWRGNVTEFSQKVRQWLILPDPDSLMYLAIFMDAHTVAGDARLLSDVRASLFALATHSDAMLGRFAAAIDSFGSTSTWWNRLLARSDDVSHLNLKKEGIFPIVHGVRSLALAHRLTETSTAARITALVADSTLSASQGQELTESLNFLMGLRLKAGLTELDTGHSVSGDVIPERLSSLERDLLKDTLSVVKRFKAMLIHRFRLDAL